jgi:hypothetical protein
MNCTKAYNFFGGFVRSTGGRMSNIYRLIASFVLATLVVSCGVPAIIAPPTASPAPTLEPLPALSIARYPEPADYSKLHPQLLAIPTYDPRSAQAWQVDPQIDLRSQDLTNVEMADALPDLLAGAFDSKTRWPSADRLPAGFDPEAIMEIGKDPGLGIRDLHRQGITGRGIGIAIIDQTLLVDHVEYKERIRVYEETSENAIAMAETSMHGAGVVSLAAGKTVGVAPESDVYYIEAHLCNTHDFENFDYSCLIEAMGRIVEINQSLPVGRKIKVLSISQWGWDSTNPQFKELQQAADQAAKEGIFVINQTLYESYGFHIQGLGRAAPSDPNQFESYLPAPLWAESFYQGNMFNNLLLIPMDSRTTASPTGVDDYVFYRWGDTSWTIPYVAGVYALSAQVNAEITPETFWEAARNTGRTIPIQREGNEYKLGIILDPQALIEEIRSR